MSYIIVDDEEVSYYNPLGRERTEELENLLRLGNCLVPSFTDADPYSVETYISQKAYKRTETVFLFDRNIYTQLISMAEGSTTTSESKYAAAIMALAHCSHAMIESNLALYEGAASGARGGWRRQLQLLHGSDEISPVNWAALALGDASRFQRRIPKKPLSPASLRFDPRMKLRSYGYLYPAVLKIAELQRTSTTNDIKMFDFLRWLYEIWQFSPGALLLARMAFSPQPMQSCLRGTRGSDRERALQNIRNATWDTVHVTEWYRRMQRQSELNHLYVFCSRDQASVALAKLFRKLAFQSDELALFKEAKFSHATLSALQRYVASLNNPKRAFMVHKEKLGQHRKNITKQLEVECLLP